MITKKYHYRANIPQLLKNYGDIDKMMFFDIETTGLSPNNSFVYLISFAYFENNELILIQLFAEDMSQERDILNSFDKSLRNFTILGQFNGERFDIPYLKARYAYHESASHLSSIESLDIYLHTKQFKKLFSSSNCKLKTFEKLLNLPREDKIDGGEAIRYYYQYVSNKDPYALHLCLLHNKEDVLNLPALSELIIFEQLKDVEGFSISTSETEDTYRICVQTGCHMDLSLSHRFDDVYFSFSDNTASLQFEKSGSFIKLHYGDCKNYLYLKNEGYAVEASYGKLVPVSSAVKADIHTAFQPIAVPSEQKDIIFLWNTCYHWFLKTFDSKKGSAAK